MSPLNRAVGWDRRSNGGRIPKGRFHLCPNGSHMAMYDDQQTYFEGLIGFISDVERDAG